jgi:hypothetical protein
MAVFYEAREILRLLDGCIIQDDRRSHGICLASRYASTLCMRKKRSISTQFERLPGG